MINIVVIIFAIILFVFLLYAVIPTVVARISGYGITKKLKEENGIVLTFDDGPNPEYTPKLLDLLYKYGVKATFFVVGSKVERNPEIIKRIHQEGHTIGIHHFYHVSSWFISPLSLAKQLNLTENAISKYTNEKVQFYRPPWGQFNIFTPFLSRGYDVIMWSHIFGDWKAENCKNNLLNQLRTIKDNGSILLLHDCGETPGADKKAPQYMMESLQVYLQESKAKGINFIPLAENSHRHKGSL